MPSVGFKLDWHFISASSILDALSPLLDKLVDGERTRFNIERPLGFDVTVATDDGFNYVVNPRQVSVAFQHKLRVKPMSGGLPVMEMLSRPLPFTKLLPQVGEKLIDATLLLPGPRTRRVIQVGVVVSAKVAIDDVPPGITRFINYVGRPWKGRTEFFNFQITADVGKTADWSDRCIHGLTKAEEDQDQLVSIQFDWQRAFSSSRLVTSESLKQIMAQAEKAALTYFEDLGEGTRFDEDLIRELAGAKP